MSITSQKTLDQRKAEKKKLKNKGPNPPDIGDPVEKTDWMMHITKGHTIASFTKIANGQAYVTSASPDKQLVPYLEASSDGYRVFVVMRDAESKEEIIRWNARFLSFIKWITPTAIPGTPRIVKLEKDTEGDLSIKPSDKKK
jgi:hypothetical protein